MIKKDIVITGLGVVSSAGIGKDIFWQSLRDSKISVDEITNFNTENLQCKLAGQVRDFDITKYISGKGLIYLDRITGFALAAAKLALDDAGYSIKDDFDDRFGVCLSVLGAISSAYNFYRIKTVEGPKAVEPMNFPNTVMNCPASHVSIRFKLRGPNMTIASGMSGGIEAIACAVNLIEKDLADMVVCGGAEEVFYQNQYAFENLGLLSKSGKISIFDKMHDGFLLSEGACFLVIETKENAQRRNGHIYGRIKGYGRGFEPTYNKPRQESITASIRQAMGTSGINRKDIGMIIAGSNGQADYDLAEAAAIREIFGNGLPISAIKSLIGESYSASGIFGAVGALFSLNENFIPKTLNFQTPFDGCNLNIVKKSYSCQLDNILINAFGCYGHSASLILSKEK